MRVSVMGTVLAMVCASTTLATSSPVSAADCAPSSDTVISGYRIVTFTQVGTCTFTLPEPTSVELLVVGGGGGGAGSDLNNVGGGGGGGVALGTISLDADIVITIGDGGNGFAGPGCGQPTNGNPSSVTDGSSSVVADGGGRGAGCGDGGDGIAGGSGGGAHPWNATHIGGTETKGSVTDIRSTPTAVVLYGSAGGSALQGPCGVAGNGCAGGGGGGAGSAAPTVALGAVTGGNGGTGISSSITGTATAYGSGGGGSGYETGGTGGVNAGHGSGDTEFSTAGVDGTGGGGGGGCYGSGRGCAGANGGSGGGSGIVVLKFRTATSDPATLLGEFLDQPKEFAVRRFLLDKAADLEAGRCNGAFTSFAAVVKGLVIKGTLTEVEETELLDSVAGLCSPL